jgi:hypothetical protein
MREVDKGIREAWSVVKKTLEETCELLIKLMMPFERAVNEGEWVGLLGVDTHSGADDFC